MEYHSALRDELDAEPCQRYENKHGVAFVHDLTEDYFPDEFFRADVVYSEISWTQGFDVFQERAGNAENKGMVYKYLLNVKRCIEELDVPGYIIGGKRLMRLLKPEDIHKVYWEFHGIQVYALLFNGADLPRYETKTQMDVLGFVAKNYGCVLDYSCGYGNTALKCIDEGAEFVMSDVNPKCIGKLKNVCMRRMGKQ